jgi:hypothetical protein
MISGSSLFCFLPLNNITDRDAEIGQSTYLCPLKKRENSG